MGCCAGKPKTLDGVKSEPTGQATEDAKATNLKSNNGEIPAEEKIDATASNEIGDNKDELKTGAPAETEKVAKPAEGKVVEVST